jgi:hypothetical protein
LDNAAHSAPSPGAAITLLIGMIQGLVMQPRLAGDVKRLHREAPKVFALYRRGIRCQP